MTICSGAPRPCFSERKMIMEPVMALVPVAVGVLLLLLVIKIFATPLKWAMKLLLNTLIGFVALFILNFLGDFVGISLGINWLNALVTGVLGVPGVVLLLLLKYFL